MRTTLDLDGRVFTLLLELTGARTKTEAVNRALEEYVRWKKRENLRALQGTLEIEDAWRELRATELGESGNG